MERIIKHVRGIMKKNPAEIISKSRNKVILRQLTTTCELCQKLNLTDSKNRLEMFNEHLQDVGRNASEVYTDLHGLFRAFVEELCRITYVFIPAGKFQYLEQEKLFGDCVFQKYPSARDEIKAAGNCLAADLHDAVIFHLMRAVEYGLRAFAKKLDIPITGDEMEYEGWKNIIDQMYKKVKALTDSAQGTKREKSELRELYNGVMGEFISFKDEWRNNIMHTRGKYDEKQARKVFERVNDFMNRLAQGGISEPKQ